MLFVPLLQPSALSGFHSLAFIKRAGGCGGGRAVLFIAAGAAPALSELPLSSRPATPPPGPAGALPAPLPQGAPAMLCARRKPLLPARLRPSTAPHKVLGEGGRERGKKNPKPQTTPNPPFPCSARDAERREAAGGEPAAPPPSAEENAAPKGRRSHDGGCPHTTRSATGSAVPAAGRPSRRPGHGGAAAFHIINPPEFGGEAIFVGWVAALKHNFCEYQLRHGSPSVTLRLQRVPHLEGNSLILDILPDLLFSPLSPSHCLSV